MLQLDHKKFDVYSLSKSFTLKCYELTESFPVHERYNLSSQIRRAAMSIMLNIAEGSARKTSAERRRFFEISRSSLVEIDTALDIAVTLNYIGKDKILEIQPLCIRCFGTLSGLIRSNS